MVSAIHQHSSEHKIGDSKNRYKKYTSGIRNKEYRTSRVTCSITEKDNAAGAKTSGEVKDKV